MRLARAGRVQDRTCKQGAAAMAGVITDWDSAKTAQWGKAPILARHDVHEREMFSDAGLIRLLDTYPREHLGVWTMSAGPDGKSVFRNGTAGDLPGADLLKAVASGRLWLNLRAANHHLAEYASLSDELFGSLEAGVPGLKTLRRDVGVLISSPNMQVHYHLDIPMVALWQIRGVKRFWVYPREAPFAHDEEIEAIVLRQKDEEVRYQPGFDAHATMIDLEPGMVATWPQNAPHRIDNHGMLNVSLSCEFQTFASLVRANALFANGVLRRKFGLRPRIARDTGLRGLAKAGLARGLKLFNARKAFEVQARRTFVVDPGVPNSVRDLATA